jgi:hypothetical protein
VRRFFPAKAQRFDANGGDACGCRNPLEGVVVVTFFVLGIRVKILDFGLNDGGVMRRYLLGGVVVEPRVISVLGVFGSIRFSVVFLFIFDLLCKKDLLITLYQFGRCGFIYKAGRKPVLRTCYNSNATSVPWILKKKTVCPGHANKNLFYTSPRYNFFARCSARACLLFRK